MRLDPAKMPLAEWVSEVKTLFSLEPDRLKAQEYIRAHTFPFGFVPAVKLDFVTRKVAITLYPYDALSLLQRNLDGIELDSEKVTELWGTSKLIDYVVVTCALLNQE